MHFRPEALVAAIVALAGPLAAQAPVDASFATRIHGELTVAACCAPTMPQPTNPGGSSEITNASGVGGALSMRLTPALALRLDAWRVVRNDQSDGFAGDATSHDVLWMSALGPDFGTRIGPLDASLSVGFGAIAANGSTSVADCLICQLPLGSTSGSGVNGLWIVGGHLGFWRLIAGAQYFIPVRVIREMGTPTTTALVTIGMRW
jgi:hypothetical protein